MMPRSIMALSDISFVSFIMKWSNIPKSTPITKADDISNNDDESEWKAVFPKVEICVKSNVSTSPNNTIATASSSATTANVVSVKGPRALYSCITATVAAGAVAAAVVESRPESVSAFRSAVREALQYIASNESEARLVMTIYAPVSPETADKMALVGWVEPRSVSLSDWRETIAILSEMGLLPAGINLEPTFLGN